VLRNERDSKCEKNSSEAQVGNEMVAQHW